MKKISVGGQKSPRLLAKVERPPVDMVGRPWQSAAKGGILALTRSLAREVASRGIRVNAIAPGWIETAMTEAVVDLRPALEAQTPPGRFGEPDDIAWAPVSLACEAAKFVPGPLLWPKCGWHLTQ